MTASAAVWIGVRKEARALLPMWAVCAGIVAVIGMTGDEQFAEAARLTYFLGSIALASWSIGHEHSYGTVPLLLTLPSQRWRLLLVKAGVLLPMLLALYALILATLPDGRGFDGPELIPVLSTICALLLAPPLAMVCRSPLAGVVFAVGIMAWLHMLAQLTGLYVYGSAADVGNALAREQLVHGLRWWALLSVSVLAAAAGWVAFMQLEAIDGLPDVHWPHAWRRTPMVRAARRQHPLWLLVKKEIRLQQMTLIVTAVFIATGTVLWMLASVVPELHGPIWPVAAVYGLMLGWLTGSMASAEERHLGTLAGQTLLPVAAWQQWTIKAAVAMTLALLLGHALPFVLFAERQGFDAGHATAVVTLTTASLYVSSLCGSGMRALTVSAPLVFITMAPASSWLRIAAAQPRFALMLAGFVVLTLTLAFRNHRFSAGR